MIKRSGALQLLLFLQHQLLETKDRQADKGKKTGKLSGLRSISVSIGLKIWKGCYLLPLARLFFLSGTLRRTELPQQCCRRGWSTTYCSDFVCTPEPAFWINSTVLSNSLTYAEVRLCQIKVLNCKKKMYAQVKTKSLETSASFVHSDSKNDRTVPCTDLHRCYCITYCKSGLAGIRTPWQSRRQFWSLPLNILLIGSKGFLYNFSVGNMMLIY